VLLAVLLTTKTRAAMKISYYDYAISSFMYFRKKLKRAGDNAARTSDTHPLLDIWARCFFLYNLSKKSFHTFLIYNGVRARRINFLLGASHLLIRFTQLFCATGVAVLSSSLTRSIGQLRQIGLGSSRRREFQIGQSDASNCSILSHYVFEDHFFESVELMPRNLVI
jgi:hypothetical protein